MASADSALKNKALSQIVCALKEKAAVIIAENKKDMLEAAQNLEFEKAAFLRDQLKQLQELPTLEIIETENENKK